MRKFLSVILFVGFLAMAGCTVAATTSPPDGGVLQLPDANALQVVDQEFGFAPSTPFAMPYVAVVECVMDVVATVPVMVQALPVQTSDGYAEAPDHVPVAVSLNRESNSTTELNPTMPQPLPGGV